MPSSCKELREALRQCLQESECVMAERRSASECLRKPYVDELPIHCQQLKKGFGDCRRGMIDMRKRFRGNMSASIKDIQEADKSGRSYQLYAGTTALPGVGTHITDGNEEIQKDWREVENEKYRDDLARELAGQADDIRRGKSNKDS